MAELINKTDTLNEGREKLNAAIENAEQAKWESDQALNKANSALAKSESTQTQLDTIVIDGDSSVEAAQARVSVDGTAYGTLKERLDAEHQEVTTQLAHYASDKENLLIKGMGERIETGTASAQIYDNNTIAIPVVFKKAFTSVPTIFGVPRNLVGGRPLTVYRVSPITTNAIIFCSVIDGNNVTGEIQVAYIAIGK